MRGSSNHGPAHKALIDLVFHPDESGKGRTGKRHVPETGPRQRVSDGDRFEIGWRMLERDLGFDPRGK